MYIDRTLKCRDCSEPFLWTAGEQTFYREKGLQNVPVRCPKCRGARKVEMGVRPRAEHHVICADCGSETTVPFIPRQNRPVYCGRCYAQAKQAESTSGVAVHAS
jgi:CxxC-x17-CxxC domain-containing protein